MQSLDLLELTVYSGFLGFIGHEVYQMRAALSGIKEVLKNHELRLEKMEGAK